jgi:hypothetical protein
MKSHVLGITADVSDKEKRTPSRHAKPYQQPRTTKVP